jgi:adenosylcobinamide-GDP ribazoletransferase
VIRGLLVALGFLTRLPIPAGGHGNARALASSVAWYPLVGLLLGALLCALDWLLQGAPTLVGAAVLLTVWVVLTGALHLDGLADSADAWIGGLGDRERTLSIMKDPRSGPAGVVSVMLVLLLKFAAIASLPPVGTLSMMNWALLLAPLLARAGLTALFLWMPYARREGLGTPLLAAPRAACLFALMATLAICLGCGWRGLTAAGIAVLVWLAWCYACMDRLQGFTGDTAGALTEMTEAAIVVALAIAG